MNYKQKERTRQILQNREILKQQQKQLLRLPAVEAITGFKHAWLYELIARDEFPAPIKIGKRAVAWDSKAIEDWIDKKLEA